MMRLIILLLITVSMSMNIFAQEADKIAQPTIMVIPFSKKHISPRMEYERNEMVRIAITKVKEGFDARGVNTIDFMSRVKQLSVNDALENDQANSLKDEVIGNSGADIYIEVEASKNAGNSGNNVNVILTAYDAFSGESLANKTSSSPTMYTDNFEKLTEKAIEKELDNLLATIQEKFNLIRENGRTVVLTVGVSEDADFDLDAETDDGDFLSDYIETIVEEFAFKNSYHVQGITSNKIIFDLVKIPLKTEKGRNYRVSRFASLISRELKNLGYEVNRTIVGNKIVITIQ